MAELDLSSSVSVGSSYDTNATQLASIEIAPPDSDGKRKRDGAYMFVSASVGAKLGAGGPLQGQLQATYNHSDAVGRKSLSHDDYGVSGQVDWHPGEVYDVSLRASQNRAPIGLADIGGVRSVEQTATTVQWTLRLRPTPHWQLGFSPGWTETLTPLVESYDFQMITKGGSASIEYMGAGALVPGIGATRTETLYSGIAVPTRYKQQAAFATLNYKVTAFTTFGLNAGKTWRDTKLRDPGANPAALSLEGKDSAFTGNININRQLTPKTGVNIGIFRNFQQYDAGVNTSIGTGFNVGVNWAATARFNASLTTAFTESKIDNLLFAGNTIQRTDLVRTYSLAMNYRATRALTVSTSVTRNIRRSEIWVDQYNSTTGALSFVIRFD